MSVPFVMLMWTKKSKIIKTFLLLLTNNNNNNNNLIHTHTCTWIDISPEPSEPQIYQAQGGIKSLDVQNFCQVFALSKGWHVLEGFYLSCCLIVPGLRWIHSGIPFISLLTGGHSCLLALLLCVSSLGSSGLIYFDFRQYRSIWNIP